MVTAAAVAPGGWPPEECPVTELEHLMPTADRDPLALAPVRTETLAAEVSALSKRYGEM